MSADDALGQLIRQIVREELNARIAELDKPAVAMVTVEAYAAARSIGRSTVRAAIRDGRLRFERIGRAVRIPSDAAIAQPHRVQADTPSARADRVLAKLGGRR